MFPKQSRQHWGRLCSHQSRCAATPSAKTCANNSHCPVDVNMIIQFVKSDNRGDGGGGAKATAALRSHPKPAVLRLPPSRLYSQESHGEWRLHPLLTTISRNQPVCGIDRRRHRVYSLAFQLREICRRVGSPLVRFLTIVTQALFVRRCATIDTLGYLR